MDHIKDRLLFHVTACSTMTANLLDEDNMVPFLWPLTLKKTILTLAIYELSVSQGSRRYCVIVFHFLRKRLWSSTSL